MLIRSHLLSVHHQVGITISRRPALRVLEIAKHLVVGPVLLNDIENIFDGTRLAHSIGNNRFAGHGRALERLGPVRAVATNLVNVSSQLRRVGTLNERDRTPEWG